MITDIDGIDCWDNLGIYSNVPPNYYVFSVDNDNPNKEKIAPLLLAFVNFSNNLFMGSYDINVGSYRKGFTEVITVSRADKDVS